MKIKTYDYTELLKVMNELEMEKNVLLELEKMNLKNRYIELEKKVLESGIFEDFKGLAKVQKELWGYIKLDCTSRESACLNKICSNPIRFIKYQGNYLQIYLTGHGNYRLILDRDEVAWVNEDSYGDLIRNMFNGDEKKHLETRILLFEALLNSYEDYRTFVMKKVNEELNKKAKENLELAMREIPKMTNDTECDMKCNMCDGKLDYLNYKGTHIWVCEDCPNIQFECVEDKDVENLIEYLNRT